MAIAVHYLHAAAEIKGEVETRRAINRSLSAEVEKSAGGLTEWLHGAVAAKVEFPTDGRRAQTIDTVAHQRGDGESWPCRRHFGSGV